MVDPSGVSSDPQNVVYVDEREPQTGYVDENTVRGSVYMSEWRYMWLRSDPGGSETVIRCLMGEESRNEEFAKGDHGFNCDNILFESPYCAFGSLQFWQTTWKENCMDKYGMLARDIWDEEKQLICGALMLEENPNNLYVHWKATADECVKNL